MDSAVDDADAFVKVQALWSLEKIGTDRVLPVVERAINDGDSDVARKARDAAAAIRTDPRRREGRETNLLRGTAAATITITSISATAHIQ
jgi:HEAT repeat protein